jgi:hypothetical protein
MQDDAIAGLEAARDGLLADARDAGLRVRFVRVGDVQIERDLSVNADGLYALNDARPGAL